MIALTGEKNRQAAEEWRGSVWRVFVCCLLTAPAAVWMCAPVYAQEVSSSDSNSPAVSKAVQPSPPFQRPMAILREEEDWSFLRDPSQRTDPWDPLKYIRLGRREGWYLTLGAETRQFYEGYRNELWGSGLPDDNGYLLQRYMMHSDFHLGRRFRVFAQLKSGLVIGRKGQPRPVIDEDRFDLNQAWMDFNFALKPGAAEPPVTLRIGRQELNYGSGRLVSVREGPNVRAGFDGLRLIVHKGAWRVDGFAVKPVNTTPEIFDDAPDHGQTFWGGYATGSIRWVPFLSAGKVDLYYLGLRRKLAIFDQGPGSEMRHTLGGRIWQRQPEREVDYDFEGAFQFGTFRPLGPGPSGTVSSATLSSGSIRAWTLAAGAGYTFHKVRFRPRVGVNSGVASGDKNPRNPDLQTFFAPFPDGHYFGQIAQNGPLNIMGFRPILTLNFIPGLMLNAELYFFWRQSLHDGIYAIPGFPLRTGQISSERYIGTQPQVEIFWIVNNHVMLSVHHARFIAGPFLHETPPGRNVGYMCAWIAYRF